jgi:hypothetical protein
MSSSPISRSQKHQIRKLLDARGPFTPVKTITDFISQVQEITNRWQEQDWKETECDEEELLNDVRIVGQVWFRGQSSSDRSLSPGLYREGTYKNLLKQTGSPAPDDDAETRITALFDLEHEMRIDFTTYGRLLNPANEAKSGADWYFLMQHHGLPTRLLDWTTSALAALFFCVQKYQRNREGTETSPETKLSVAVWMLDAYWLAHRMSDDWSAPLLAWAADADRYIPPLEELIDRNEDTRALFPKHAMPIEPPALHPRVAAQEGRFIIFGQTTDLLDEQVRLNPLKDCTGFEELRLYQIGFEIDDVDALLRDLAQLGVSRRTLFPDLAGLADFVTWKHLHKVRGYTL